MAKVEFGKTERFQGDMHVAIIIDGRPAGHMNKSWDGQEWYTYGDEHELLEDVDLGSNLARAKSELRKLVHRNESITKERAE